MIAITNTLSEQRRTSGTSERVVRVSASSVDRTESTLTPSTILEILYQACERDPAAPALVFDDGIVVTRGELRAGVEGFAGYLSTRLQPGDALALMLGNRAEWMIAWFAAVGCRVTAVGMNPAARGTDAGHILRDSSARLVITDREHEALFADLRTECPAIEDVLVVGADEPNGLSTYFEGPIPLRELAERGETEDVTNVYYTSGTTGVPKGCMVDHAYWLRYVDLFQRLYGMAANDRMICCLQFFYNDPPWQTLLSLAAGTPLVVMRHFSVSRFWPLVREQNVSILFGIASTANLMLKAPPDPRDRDHGVRLAVHVGIPANLHQALVDRWGVPWVEIYGLTESGAVVAMPLECAEEMIGSGSIGRPCPEVEVRVVDAEGHDVRAGTMGELLLRAPGMMRGYINRPEATAEIMRGGWLHSGDLVSMDDRGFIYFRGRAKDIVRRAGENVAATEVEQVLRGHPHVLEAAIIPAPDDVRGEEVHAVIVLVNANQASETTPAELVEFCAERLAKYKVPRYITFRARDFPRTPSMRVKKEEIRGTPTSWDRQVELGW